VLDVAPNSQEAEVAKKGLDGPRSAHNQRGGTDGATPRSAEVAWLASFSGLSSCLAHEVPVETAARRMEGAGYRRDGDPQRRLGPSAIPCGVFVVPVRH
jgi:hypothetical protein